MPQPPAIRLDRDVKELVARDARRFGMTEKEVTSRVCRWFSKQDHAVKTFVLGLTQQDRLEALLKASDTARKP